MDTAIVYDDAYLKHKQIEEHPECPQRLQMTMEYLYRTNLIDLVDVIPPRYAEVEDLTRVHSLEHVNYIRCLSEVGPGKFSVIDSDTYVCQDTYDVARLSAGGVLAGGEAVWRGDYKNCFALTRPPGHHASTNQATGFCYFDNASIMIKYLQKVHGVKKVFLFDWDAHAPNGTMGTFYNDSTVLNMSIHQDPTSFYPGNGFINQIGEGPGRGDTINFPLQKGSADPDYIYFIEEFVIDKVAEFKPDLIVVAAGQDSHQSDLVSQLNLTDAGFAKMTTMMMDLAKKHCGGKLILELEGGYNLKTFPATNHAIISALCGLKYDKDIEGSPTEHTKNLLTQLDNTLHSSRIWDKTPQN